MYLDGGVKDGVKPMIPEEGELLLTSVNMSESVSEGAQQVSHLHQRSENLVPGLLKQDQVLRMMNRGSCY